MRKTGKKNFTKSEMEVLLSEVEASKNVLFGTLSSGISSKRKRNGWESVCEVVNAVGSEKRTQAEVKKKGWGLFKTFHTLRTGLLTFAHRDNHGLVRKILSCSLTSKKQQVTNFNHQLVMML